MLAAYPDFKVSETKERPDDPIRAASLEFQGVKDFALRWGKAVGQEVTANVKECLTLFFSKLGISTVRHSEWLSILPPKSW